MVHFSIVPTEEDVRALPHFRRDQLTLTKFLGSGAFGEVFEGIARNISNKAGETRVAVKVCGRHRISDPKRLWYFSVNHMELLYIPVILYARKPVQHVTY